MTDALTIAAHGDVTVATIDDGKANALTPELVDGLRVAVRDAGRALVIAGRPGRFSAGFDLKIMMSGVDAMRALVYAGAELFLDIFTAPIPVVAAATGHAIAGGALLLLASDQRIG